VGSGVEPGMGNGEIGTKGFAAKEKREMEQVVKARWQNWEGDATEDATLRESREGIFVESIIRSRGQDNSTTRYTITGDVSWRVRKVEIELSRKEEKLRLESDGLGRWSNESGAVPDLDGAIDIDISVTPFTNTLPIRRLGLDAGQSAEISVVYITVPDLNISLDNQRYTCVIPDKLYRFESLDSGFVREIETDEYGLVLLYPGLFKRV
jgi:hypothetical protein